MKNFESLIKSSLDVIKNFPPDETVVSISGGIDSLVVLDLSIKTGITSAVFCDTSIEFPETLEFIKLIQDFYNIDLSIVKPTKNFFELLESGLNPPSRRFRWCCKPLKLSPLSLFGKKREFKYFITGTRRDESFKRKKYNYLSKDTFHSKNKDLNPLSQINPILYWKRSDVWNYIKKYSLPTNPLYDMGFKRTGCWICPHRTKNEFYLLKKIHPELFNLFITTFRDYLIKKGIKYNENQLIDIWMKGIYQSNVEIVGELKENSNYYYIDFNDFTLIKRIENIFSKKQYHIKNQIIYFKKEFDFKKLKVFIEKSLNCVGCGTCLSLCDALSLDKNQIISIDKSICNFCLKCISSSKIRKSCMARNYKSIIYELKDFTDIPFHYEGQSRIGLIRTRISFDDVIFKLKNLRSEVYNEKYHIKTDDSLSLLILNSPGYTEILITPKKLNIEQSFIKIRALLGDTETEKIQETNYDNIIDSSNEFQGLSSPCGKSDYILQLNKNLNEKIFESLRIFGQIEEKMLGNERIYQIKGKDIYLTFRQNSRIIKFNIFNENKTDFLLNYINSQINSSLV